MIAMQIIHIFNANATIHRISLKSICTVTLLVTASLFSI